WVSASYVREPLEEYFRMGYESYLRKNYAAAIDYYQSITNIEPTFVKGHYWLAKSYYAKGDNESAYHSIVEALRLDERNIDCRVLASKLAGIYFKEAQEKFRAKRHNEAVVAFQKVLALNSGSALSWIELGKSYRELGMPLEARGAWSEALKIEPDNTELHALLFMDVGGGQPALAKVESGRVVALGPDRVLIRTSTTQGISPVIADDSLEIVRVAKTKKGTKIESAVRSVVSLTKSLGTPVVEKGWQATKQGNKFLVSYLCEQGAGVLESFEFLVDVDTKGVSAVNANSRLLMDRW
ncbi:MAG: tetratricopeptide repeat protein, partial [Candidatus Margulisiibacteriota bacterium]